MTRNPIANILRFVKQSLVPFASWIDDKTTEHSTRNLTVDERFVLDKGALNPFDIGDLLLKMSKRRSINLMKYSVVLLSSNPL